MLYSTDVQSLYTAKFLLRHDNLILSGYTGYSTLKFYYYYAFQHYSLNDFHVFFRKYTHPRASRSKLEVTQSDFSPAQSYKPTVRMVFWFTDYYMIICF